MRLPFLALFTALPLLSFGAPPPTPLEPLTTVPLAASGGRESIQGIVLSAAGPVAGATVVAVRTDAPDLVSRLPDRCAGPAQPAVELRCDSSKRLLAQAARTRAGAAPAVSRATAGADGRFRLDGLAAGEHALYAFGSGLVGLVTGIRAGGASIELEATTGAMIGGSVFSEGQRTAGLSVTAFNVDAPVFLDTVSGPNGSLRLGPVPEGRWIVLANPAGAVPDAALSEEHWGPLSAVDLTVHEPRRIVGTVRAGGRPAPHVRVELPYVVDDEPFAVTETDARGRFVFEGLEPREYTVTAVSGALAARGKAILWRARSAAVELKLGSASFVRGRTVGPDGAPIAGAELRAESVPMVRSGKEGAFRLGPFAPGTYHLDATALHWRSTRAEVPVRAGRNAETRLVLTPALTVSGRIVFAGAPVGAARIDRDEEDEPYGAVLAESRDDGTFEVGVESAGESPIKVEHPDHPAWRGFVTALSPPLDVRLEPGLSVSGRVVDEAGRGLRSRLRLFDPEKPGWPALRAVETDLHGRFVVRGLPAARLRVSAVARAREWDEAGRTRRYLARSASAVLDLRRELPGELTLQVGGGAGLRGRLTPPPAGGEATVTLTVLPYDWLTDHDDEDADRHLFERDGAYGGGYVGPDGRFEFLGLRPGRYAIDSRSGGPLRAPPGPQGARAGTGEPRRPRRAPADRALAGPPSGAPQPGAFDTCRRVIPFPVEAVRALRVGGDSLHRGPRLSWRRRRNHRRLVMFVETGEVSAASSSLASPRTRPATARPRPTSRGSTASCSCGPSERPMATDARTRSPAT